MTIKHDGLIHISIGRSREETSWKNEEWQWSAFVSKVANTHRTAETYQQYITGKAAYQDKIKDIGGFVGGFINQGRRLAKNILTRQLITLDIDFGHIDFWADFSLLFSCAGCLYSTHKHSLKTPRFRLIIPLNREVLNDEYEAIARKIASDLDIEIFDPTTFQSNRLMYWPSTASDGEFVFEYQDGKWLDADKVLAEYKNWKDSSSWAVSSRTKKLIDNSLKKQGDPLDKPGLIGAFCRTYDIHEAIAKYLDDVYEPTDDPNRYTYIEGSTGKGLIIYDDKFAYSHHGSDPASMLLCNAFDLVRIHLHGLEDDNSKEDTPGNKLPSYKLMMKTALEDKAVMQVLGTEKYEEARKEFDGIIPEDLQDEEGKLDSDKENLEWLSKLKRDGTGEIENTIANIKKILENDVLLKGAFAFNEFEQREVALRDLPWRKINKRTAFLTDTDDASIRDYLEEIYKIVSTNKIYDAVKIVSYKNRFHPVKNYLEGLKWDGVERIESLLVDWLGAEDSDYTRAVTRKALVAAIARIYEPGIKYEYVLTLGGDEGKGKSTIIAKLGGEWFSDSFVGVQNKEAIEQLHGVWLMEMGEMAGLKRADVEAIKSYVSKTFDKYRPAYGKRVEQIYRQCVFFATTNSKNPLREAEGGNRRFWVVDIGVQHPEHDVFKMDKKTIGQIWAEAIILYKAGEKLYLDRELEAVAKKVQREHTEQDDRVGMIKEFLNKKLPEDWTTRSTWKRKEWLNDENENNPGVHERKYVTAAEIWCELLGGNQKDMTTYNTKFIHQVLRNMEGWEEIGRQRVEIYGSQRTYQKQVKRPKNIKEALNWN